MKGQAQLFSRSTVETDEWETPQKFFDELDAQYHFTLDPCATAANAKCPRFFTKADNGLLKSWGDEIVFCNPPYSSIKHWVRKAHEELEALTVMLIPARTDTAWFHVHVYQKPHTIITFLRGRLKFGDSKNSAPFPSMLVEWNPLLRVKNPWTP